MNNKHKIKQVTLTTRTAKGLHIRVVSPREIKGKFSTFHYEGRTNG